MRTLFYCTLFILGICRNSVADGTVAFNNFVPPPWQGGFVWFNPTGGPGTNGGFLAPAGYHVELLFGPLGSTTLSNSATIFNVTNTPKAGQFFDGQIVVLAGMPDGFGSADTNSVALEIRGWTGPYSDYNSALAAGAPVGATAIFSNPTGNGGVPPSVPANLVGWLANNPLVIPAPEPSTIALGALGIASLLLFRRRKQCSTKRQGCGVMKNWLLSFLLFTGISTNISAQGTIAFQNFNQVLGRVYILTNSGYVLAPVGYHVELLYGSLGGSITNSAGIFNNTSTSNGQFFDGTILNLSGITAGTGSGDTNNVMLQLRGWTGPYSDWNSAITSGSALLGFTTPFSNPTGGAGTALPANMVGWLASNPLLMPDPEPSTIAVGVLGSGVMLLLHRRRRRGKS